MKNLKKYLVLFSFLFLFFIPKAYAIDGLISDYYTEFKYSDDLLNAKETYQSKIDTLIEAIDNNPQQFFGNNLVDIGHDIISINKDDLANNIMSFKTGKFLNGYNSIYNYGTTATFCMSVRYWTYNFDTGSFSGSTSGYVCYDTDSIEANPSDNQTVYLDDYFYVDNYLNSETTYKNMLFEFVSGNVNHPLKVGKIIHLTSGNIAVSDFFDSLLPKLPSCLAVPYQIGEVSNVSGFTFNIRGYTSESNPLIGDIYLVGTEFVGIGINADNFTNITYESASNNESESYSFSYNVSWLNEWASGNPAYKIHYELYDDTDDVIESYTSVIMSVNLVPSNVMLYFRENVYIFIDDNCKPGTLSYGYIDYTTNNTITSDPIIKNYISNLSLPNLRFFNNLNTLLPAGPVDLILTLPISILTALSHTLSGNCIPLTVRLPFVNRDITLQCMNSFYNNIGFSNFFDGVGLLVSTIILINYFIFLYNWLDDILRIEHKKVTAWGFGEVK